MRRDEMVARKDINPTTKVGLKLAAAEAYTSLPAETRMKVRDALHAHPELIP